MDNQELKQQLDIDYMTLLYEDDSVSIVECLVLHEGINRNKCNIPHDVIINALPSLANKPIWGIPNSKIFRSSSTDFVEHAHSDEEAENIIIFGVFPESGVKNTEFVELNDKIYTKVQAILFKMYAPIAMSILENRDGNTKISIEINVKGWQDDKGILNVEEMDFLSATVLGLKIPEGIEDSQLNIVRFSMDEAIKESNQHYLAFANEINENKEGEMLELTDTAVLVSNPVEETKDNELINEEIKNTLEGGEKETVENVLENNAINEKESLEATNSQVQTNAQEETTEGVIDPSNSDPEITNPDNDDPSDDTDLVVIEMNRKYADLEQKFSIIENELKMAQEKVQEFEKKNELEKMSSLLEEFSHVFNSDEMMEMKNKMSEITFAELDTEVTNKAKEFARKAKSDTQDKAEDPKEEVIETPAEEKVENKLNFSISPFGVFPTYDFSKTLGEGGLDSIIKNSGVKI